MTGNVHDGSDAMRPQNCSMPDERFMANAHE